MRLWTGEGEKWVPWEDMLDINVSTGFNEENIFAISMNVELQTNFLA